MAAATSSGSSSLVKVVPPDARALPIWFTAMRLMEQPVERSSALHTAAHLMSIFMDSSLFHAPRRHGYCFLLPANADSFFPGRIEKRRHGVTAERLPPQRLDPSFKVLVPLSFEAAFGFQLKVPLDPAGQAHLRDADCHHFLGN